MNPRQILLIGALGLAYAGAFADDITLDTPSGGASQTRASVRAQVIAARQSGSLLPAGELYNGKQEPAISTVARSTVKSEVLAARAAGDLAPAGDYDPVAVAQANAPSTRARADVKAEVLAARDAGELLPAGEGNPTSLQTRTTVAGSQRHPFKAIASWARGEK